MSGRIYKPSSKRKRRGSDSDSGSESKGDDNGPVVRGGGLWVMTNAAFRGLRIIGVGHGQEVLSNALERCSDQDTNGWKVDKSGACADLVRSITLRATAEPFLVFDDVSRDFYTGESARLRLASDFGAGPVSASVKDLYGFDVWTTGGHRPFRCLMELASSSLDGTGLVPAFKKALARSISGAAVAAPGLPPQGNVFVRDRDTRTYYSNAGPLFKQVCEIESLCDTAMPARDWFEFFGVEEPECLKPGKGRRRFTQSAFCNRYEYAVRSEHERARRDAESKAEKSACSAKELEFREAVKLAESDTYSGPEEEPEAAADSE